MPLATIQELFQLEKHCEFAFRQVLVKLAAFTEEQIFISRSSDAAITPRVELKVTCQGITNRQARPFPDNKRWAFNTWTGKLESMIVTRREDASQDHYAALGRLRAALQGFLLYPQQMGVQPEAQIWPGEIIVLNDIFETETEGTWIDDENCDYTKINWTIVFNLHPDAWPLNI